MSEENEIQKIANEARDTFDLGEFLQTQLPRVVNKVTVYTDEAAGDELGGHEMVQESLANGVQVPRLRTWGLKGEYAELTATEAARKENAPRVAEIEERVAELRKRLNDTSLTFELHSIPTSIRKDARRKARKELGISSKGVPADLEDDFSEEISAQYLAASCGGVTRGDGATISKLTVEDARNLIATLPLTEQSRLLDTVSETLFATHISQSAVEDADF